jgi:hypothetical protein
VDWARPTYCFIAGLRGSTSINRREGSACSSSFIAHAMKEVESKFFCLVAEKLRRYPSKKFAEVEPRS